jgi:hypothetical protein
VRRKSVFVVLAICALAARELRAQGGPPMITDDPGTPGNGKWEINLAFAFEHRSEETSYDSPAIDLPRRSLSSVTTTVQSADLVPPKRR